MSAGNIVIVGGGFAGLASALWASEKSTRPVILLEREASLGGLYSSIDAGQAGLFDHGPHLFYETGKPEIDAIVRGVLPDADWIELSDNRKDIAGIHHGGAIQEYSNYIDLRRLGTEQYRRALADFFAHLNGGAPAKPDSTGARDYFVARFGPWITDSAIEPVLRKLWGQQSGALDQLVAKVVAMDRVILFDDAVMADLMKSDALRLRLAYPRQLELPLQWRARQQRGLYPKKFGLLHVVNRIREELLKRKVTVMAGSTIEDLDIKDRQVRGIRVRTGAALRHIDEVELLHWTAGYVPLARQLGIDIADLPADAPVRLVYVNALLRTPPKMGELYYFYCFDGGYRAFRVTSFANYCPDAAGSRGWPVCIEMHFRADERPAPGEPERIAREEMLRMGLVGSPADIAWTGEYGSPTGFPIPSLRNRHFSAGVEQRIAERRLANLTTAGASFSSGNFFLHEILAAHHAVLSPWLGK